MPDLTPVEYDPFNDPVIPVDHDPFDPLAASAGIAPAGTPTIADMNLGPSWVQKALEQSQRDREAFARGGVREMLKDTEGTQYLAGGFGDGGIVGRTKSVISDAGKAVLNEIHGVSSTPRDVAESTMAANSGRGLDINAEEGLDRVRLNHAREEKAREKGTDLAGAPSNPRTVIKAPENSGLPDFVAGRPTVEDWVKRHEKLLSPGEINQASRWYTDIYDHFLTQTKGDAEQAKQYMRSWLVAQQNVDVSGAMANVLLQKEQLARGVPAEQMRGGGMPNPTAAARAVLRGEPVTGVGQKISDFVDSAEGKNVRSWMANHPDGGSPFVVDVHTARDTGMVDQELKNHLKRLGYDSKAVDKLKTDLGTSPSSPQYENRAKFGRELTDHLNKIGWQGRKDWTPAEAQAIGWMGMTRLTANKADDVVTGLMNNMRNISMELSPGEGSPWAAKYGERFGALPAHEQYALTHQMTSDAIDHASRIAGVDVRDIVHGTGGWQSFQNPSTVAQTFASKDGAEIAANVLGHLLNQTEVWSTKVKAPTSSPKGFAVDLVAHGQHNIGSDEGLRDLWQKITAADPMKDKKPFFEGYQPIRTRDGKPGIRVLVDRGGGKTATDLKNAVEGPISKVLESEPGDWRTQMHEAEITKARNDWKKQTNGQGYTSRLVDLLGRDPAADLHSAGAQLEKGFQAAIEAAERRTAGGEGAGGPGGGVVPSGIHAYHASPHDFDKFDISKIGTGEGAQVYGHGLYFAENPKTAQDYRATFANQARKLEDVTDVAEALPVSLKHHPEVANKILNHVHSAMSLDGVAPGEFLDKHTVGKGLEPAYKRAAEIVGKGSKMYEVNIKADPEHFLDWDKPLSEQHPKVQEIVGKLDKSLLRFPGLNQESQKSFLPQELVQLKDPGVVSKVREAGIPGIKYLDQGSRPGNIHNPVEQAAHDVIQFYGGDRAEATKEFEKRLSGVKSKYQGKNLNLRGDRPDDPQEILKLLKSDWKGPKQTSNYVVFDDKLIDIIKKYGLAGLVAGGAAHFSMQPIDHDPFAEVSQ